MSERTPEIIRNLREDHELKQDTIAKHLGVVQQTYSNYEKGHTSLPLDYLVKLAKFYNVSSDFLLGLTTFQKPSTEMDKIYVQGKTLGEIASALSTLSTEKRKMLLDFLSYLLARQKEEQQKQKTWYLHNNVNRKNSSFYYIYA